MTTRRSLLAGAGAALVIAPAAVAQQQRRVARISYLAPSPSGNVALVAFREGLRHFGYVEGKDIAIDELLSPNIPDLPELAARAVASKPDVIVTFSAAAAVAAKAQTTTIPIVFAAPGDPVALGLVASLARPGGNLTGPVTLAPDLVAKRLQMLSEFVPGLARVAVFYNSDYPAIPSFLAEINRAAKILNLEVPSYAIGTAGDLALAIASAAAAGAQALFFGGGGAFVANNAQLIADEALKRRLPSAFDARTTPDAGGLLSYGSKPGDAPRRAAYYVDRILKGAKPADLPVEQPMVFDLVINKKTADALGLAIPEHLRVFATEIIE